VAEEPADRCAKDVDDPQPSRAGGRGRHLRTTARGW
jgi:hypothetical protein